MGATLLAPDNPRWHSLYQRKGFTVIEVVLVIILAAVLAAAYVSYYRHSDTDIIAQTHILKSHIRYAQARAMNTDRTWGIHFNRTQRAYWLFRDGDDETKILLPGQKADSVNLAELKLDITGNTFNLSFDSWGRPGSEERAFINGQLTLSLNRSGRPGDDIIVTENTGFIP